MMPGFQTIQVMGPCNKSNGLLTIAVSQINAQWTLFGIILQEICAKRHKGYFAQSPGQKL